MSSVQHESSPLHEDKEMLDSHPGGTEMDLSDCKQEAPIRVVKPYDYSLEYPLHLKLRERVLGPPPDLSTKLQHLEKTELQRRIVENMHQSIPNSTQSCEVSGFRNQPTNWMTTANYYAINCTCFPMSTISIDEQSRASPWHGGQQRRLWTQYSW